MDIASFGLRYRKSKLPIITPGINKNYLELPYNFIWGRALELLIECHTLRVIGCSLSHNDLGLIDLLFKAHLARKEPFVIQLIDHDPPYNSIKRQYGFFPKIETALQIEGGTEGGIISDAKIGDNQSGANPFVIWLKAKINRDMASDAVAKTTYVKKVIEDADG